MVLPVLCLLQACSGTEGGGVSLDVSLSESEVSHEANSVFVRVACEVSWTLEIVPAVDWASLSATSGSGNKNSIILTYAANKASEIRSLTVVATAGKVSSSATLKQLGYTPPAPSAGDGGRSTKAPFAWLELPATDADDGLDFIWHMTEAGGRTVRNYSCYWNYSDRVSIWVAYPLCGAYLGSVGRSDAWGFDPQLPAVSQQNVIGSYLPGNNGYYDRGHQIPSADRTASYKMNATTFYSTNMTPQKNVLNGGIWASLEGKVRDWARSSDTLYVVTGCSLKGASFYVLDRSNVQITAPTAYFKAVLRYQKNSTVGRKGYLGAAFWYDHETTNWSGKSFSKAQSLSISELEERLGYTLFVNLPELVGSATASEIKSESPAAVNWWW